MKQSLKTILPLMLMMLMASFVISSNQDLSLGKEPRVFIVNKTDTTIPEIALFYETLGIVENKKLAPTKTMKYTLKEDVQDTLYLKLSKVDGTQKSYTIIEGGAGKTSINIEIYEESGEIQLRMKEK